MNDWSEVATGVFHRRYEPLDVSVSAVVCGDGLLVVDTRSGPAEADQLRADLRALSPLPVRWAVNTHGHYDHCFGNQRFGRASDLAVPIYGHERVPEQLRAYEAPELLQRIAEGVEPAQEWRAVVITPPTELVGAFRALSLGGRAVELTHLGRGHTDNDLVVHVPDAAAWLVGDLVEESGPPAFGVDSFPLDWPCTLAALVGQLETGAVLVPGHGAPVDAAYAARQRDEIAEIGTRIRAAHVAGLTPDEAHERVSAGSYPPETIREAVRAGYAQLAALRPKDRVV